MPIGERVDSQRSNVLLIILDDVGLDAVGCYPGSNEDAITPAIDELASNGLRFETVWAYPACSPTRSTILTGQYGFRTGIGSIVKLKNDDPGLLNSVTTLPERVRASAPDVRTAFLGKWHLGGTQHGPDHAREQGFEHFRGTVSNLGGKGQKNPYFVYDEIIDGKEARRETYATTAVTDDALSAIERFGEDDWLVVASYHAAHGPLHAPPPELRTLEVSGEPKRSRHEHFAAMVEALDREIGRLWTSIPDETRARTTIMIVGDNGGASGQMTDAVRTARGTGRPIAGKGSLGEPGIRVPLVIAGAVVNEPGRVISELVGTSDLFDTSVELLTGPTTESETPDSVSVLPYLTAADSPAQRTWIFAERFHGTNRITKAEPSNRYALRDARYKLIEDTNSGLLRFFDLQEDPHERNNLLKSGEMTEDAIAALARFTATMAGPMGRERDAALADLK